MQFTTLLTVLAVAGSSLAQVSDIPSCAFSCLGPAIEASGCAATDFSCQCTTGKSAIAKSLLPCVCKSTCTPAEQLQLEDATNGICSSALSGSYSAVSYPTNECAIILGSSTSGSSATTTAASSSSSGSASMTSAATTATSTAVVASSSSSSASAAMTSAATTSAASVGAGAMVTMRPEWFLGGMAAAGALVL